jgi:hypothetical protein
MDYYRLKKIDANSDEGSISRAKAVKNKIKSLKVHRSAGPVDF